TIIAYLLTTVDVGIYGFALSALTLAQIVPSAIQRMIFQRMAVSSGRQVVHDPREFRRYIEAPWAGYLLVNTVVAGCCLFAYSLGVSVLLTSYAASLGILPVLMVGYLFFIGPAYTANFLIVWGQLARVGIAQGLGLAINTALGLL